MRSVPNKSRASLASVIPLKHLFLSCANNTVNIIGAPIKAPMLRVSQSEDQISIPKAELLLFEPNSIYWLVALSAGQSTSGVLQKAAHVDTERLLGRRQSEWKRQKPRRHIQHRSICKFIIRKFFCRKIVTVDGAGERNRKNFKLSVPQNNSRKPFSLQPNPPPPPHPHSADIH